MVLGWDSQDQLYENIGVKYTGYPDAPVRVLPETCRELPLEANTLLFLCEFKAPTASICPRNVLNRVLAMADEMGIDAYAAFEYEFFLFNETPDSVRAKGYRNLTSFTPGFFGYSMLRNSTHAELHHELLQLAREMDFPIEGLHTETGPGVLEAAISVDSAQAAADKAALFKTFTKVWAQRRQLMATFMAKWSNDYPGQSGHIHLSLRDKQSGQSLFYDAGQDMTMSQQQGHFIAGLQQLLPEFMAMYAPTINAYSRVIPGYWAPMQTISQVDGSVYTSRACADDHEIERSLALAVKAQKPWSQTSIAERIALCEKMLTVFSGQKEQIVQDLCWMMGRPIRYGAGELKGVEQRVRYMMGIAEQALAPVHLAEEQGAQRIIKRQPLGGCDCPMELPLPDGSQQHSAGDTSRQQRDFETFGTNSLMRRTFLPGVYAGGLARRGFQYLHLSHDDTQKVLRQGDIHQVCFTGSVKGGGMVEQALAGRFISAYADAGGIEHGGYRFSKRPGGDARLGSSL
nr:aldehyde dehydrogenase family protein [Thalassomonas actiniarum]